MNVNETMHTNPIDVERSIRGDELRALTTCRAGKSVPVGFVPVLREDAVQRGSYRLAFEMDETIHPLMNSINVTAYAHFVPWLAFERFGGSMEILNRSYQRQPEPNGGSPVEFFHHMAFDRAAAFWRTLGVHWPQGASINTSPLEAYNVLVNWRRQARSNKLPVRHIYDTSLAQAFWNNPLMSHIVPDFDQAAMDGEVELQWATPRLPISGISRVGTNAPAANVAGVESHAGVQANVTYPHGSATGSAALRFNTNSAGTPEVFAELEQSGIRLSLANLELAKKTAAFAKLRDKYSGLDDDHIIDLLMEGIRVPDEALKQPILLDRKSTIFGYSERHAMDGASLDMSVTTGKTSLNLNFRTPAMNVGGIILITVEIVPEQLYERIYDRMLGVGNPDQLPNFMRDYLDPEKVDIVQNRYVDVMHAEPNGVFGYAPLNHMWKRNFSRIGGKYYRPTPDAFVEDRQRFWSVEQLNPTLTADFYMVPATLPHSVFLDTISDPFEIMTVGTSTIIGRTVFGKVLDEDEGSYEAIMSQIDTARISQD